MPMDPNALWWRYVLAPKVSGLLKAGPLERRVRTDSKLVNVT